MIIRRRFRAGLTAAGIALTSALLAAPAASAACPDKPVSQPFKPWGDTNDYFLVAGGDFEASAGWTLAGGAARVPGSEPYGVTGRVGTASLALPTGASAVSPVVCVSLSHPTFRFFHRAIQGNSASLRVEAIATQPTRIVGLGAVNGTTAWAPSVPMTTGAASFLYGSADSVDVRFRFTADYGNWTIDDVHVDPWRRG